LFTPAVCPGALLPAQSARVLASPSMPSGDGDAVPHAELAARVASGPGLWTDWLGELGRQGLLEELLADGVIARAGHCRRYPPGTAMTGC
jgi:hypothetical protein